MFPNSSRKKKLRIQGGIVLRYFAIIGNHNLARYYSVPYAGNGFMRSVWRHLLVM